MSNPFLKITFTFILLMVLGKAVAQTKAEDTFFHIKTGGTEIPVWVKGNTASNKFLIYINGGPGLTSIDVARADMFNWSARLEENLAMVYYDQRGCGNAQGNFEAASITLAQFARDLEAVISVLESKYDHPDIFLMGHSFGSFIGVNYLLKQPEANQIKGWISVDGAYNFDYDLSWQYRRKFLMNIAREEMEKGQKTDHWQEALRWTEQNPEIRSREQKNRWREFIGTPGEIIIPEETASLTIRQYLEIGFTSSYNPIPAYLSSNLEIVNDLLNREVEGINLISTVAHLKLPTLFIWGRYDDMIAPEEGYDAFQNFGTPDRDKYFRILPNSSHEPFISDPERFKTEILEFVSKY